VLQVLGENLITLLAYHNDQAKIIRGVVDVGLFGGPLRLIAQRCYEYIDRYKKCPGDHLADLLADKLEKGEAEGSIYAEVLQGIYAQKDHINPEYVMKGQLEPFIRRQSYRSIAVDVHKQLTRDTEESLDEVDRLFRKATQTQLSVFDPGLRLSDKKQALAFLDSATEAFPTGIHELDKRGFGPTRKELWLLIANAKRGKSWCLVHLAKMSLAHQLRVVHVSLEMSAERTAQRYFQALFGLAKRSEKINTTRFKKDTLGRLKERVDVEISPKLSLQDPEIRSKLEALIDKWSVRMLDNIIIKDFPTGQLTVPQLRAYLDSLEASERFVPDLLVIDYPDLMKVDASNPRWSLDGIYKDIRGIAVERNIAIAVVSQGNRVGAKAKLVTGENVAEAYSKIAHADLSMTFSQTNSEHKIGLARLYVAAGRNDGDKFSIAISQQYAIGAFALDSVLMTPDYWKIVPEEVSSDDD
jgi:hypothetical protein